MQIKMSLTIYTVVRLVLAIDNTGWFIAYGIPAGNCHSLSEVCAECGGEYSLKKKPWGQPRAFNICGILIFSSSALYLQGLLNLISSL